VVTKVTAEDKRDRANFVPARVDFAGAVAVAVRGRASSFGPGGISRGASLQVFPSEGVQAVAALPATGNSMTAEAVGLRCALSLALLVLGHPAGLHVVDDNLPVARLGAGNGRLTMVDAWPTLEAPPPVRGFPRLGAPLGRGAEVLQ